MALSDVTHEAVLAALREHDQLGQTEFLAKYGFNEARIYKLAYKGRLYDSKAIAGAAHGFATGEPLRARDFSGGVATVVRHMGRLGFTVETVGAPAR